ncbi:NACHT domain-containing protein [Mycena sanguinolenta]|uniref:NACHT domain-containing protein n=1 Tax=Mycena sanguinolenta TaxID=230812 RepID=A0A8H6Z8M1_9AGAR|nr:NACHT domain-containing protein [Mycena sanguinolenta]
MAARIGDARFFGFMAPQAPRLPDNSGGSFFFKRGHATRGNARTLFATIAYQLAICVPCFRAPIAQVVEHDPSIAMRTIAVQMHKLISGPCRGYKNHRPVTILIDGLDECEEQDIQVEILRIIRHSSLPSRFIISSRPEAHIGDMFNSPVYAGNYFSLNVEQSFDDVHKYLCDEFSRIHHEHSTMAGIQTPWPSVDVLWELVWKSSGHFIYAATIIKFIDDKNYRPTQQLAIVLGSNSQGLPFGALDQLYMDILSSAPRQSEIIPILCAITNFLLKVAEIDQLFEFVDGETWLLLRGLHSVLQLPSEEIPFIFTHHASFLDFLNDQSRSHNFYVGGLDHRMHLAQSFLRRYAGRGQPSDWYPSHSGSWRPGDHFIPFLTSLPPSIELCPLVARMEPDHIFALQYSNFEDVLSWLKRIPSVPQDLITLWEDYVYMASMKSFSPTWAS